MYLLALLLAATQWAGPTDDAASRYWSYINGERLEFAITRTMLQAAPAWELDAANPPLAARRAIEAATRQLPTLVPNAPHWRLDSLHLKPIGDDKLRAWVYLVVFSETHPGVTWDGPVQMISLVVLMDGQTVTPSRQRWEH